MKPGIIIWKFFNILIFCHFVGCTAGDAAGGAADCVAGDAVGGAVGAAACGDDAAGGADAAGIGGAAAAASLGTV